MAASKDDRPAASSAPGKEMLALKSTVPSRMMKRDGDALIRRGPAFMRARRGLARFLRNPHVEMNTLVLARVIGVGRNAVWIACEETEDLRPASLPKRATRLHIVPGDLVEAVLLDDGRALIEACRPRESMLERVGEDGRRKTMAANVDGIAILSALADPEPHLAMIDELIAVAELNDLRAFLFFTKPDLVAGAFAGGLSASYRSLGYETVLLNSRIGLGTAEAESLLRDRRTLLIGQSGVGKSSLFRALGGTASVGEVSKTGRGRQTTTSARLHRFPVGFLIDSPGVGEFELWGYDSQVIANGFVEFRPLLGGCRFNDCAHRDEPHCAVTTAVGSGAIGASRYASYRAIADRPRPSPGSR